MKKLLFLLFIGVFSDVSGQKIKSWEYWIDDNFAGRVNTAITPVKNFHLETQLPLSAVNEGFHYFNLRFIDSANRKSSVLTRYFMKYPAGYPTNRQITGYEYWMDDAFAAKVSQSVAAATVYRLADSLNSTSLSPGFHFLNLRFKDQTGAFSGTLTRYFMKYPANNVVTRKIVAYEYWADDNYAARTTQTVSPITSFQLMDSLNLSSLSPGFHFLNLRFKDQTGAFSGILTKYFMKYPANNVVTRKIVAYEYWADDNFGARIMQTVSPVTSFHLTDSLNFGNIATGFHLLSFRFKDQTGQWSGIKTQYFMKYGNMALLPHTMTAYRFWLDNNPATMQTLNFTQPAKNIHWVDTVEMPFLTTGQHLINFQYMEANRIYSSVRTDTFNVTSCLPYGGHQISGNALVSSGQTGMIYTVRTIKNASAYHWTVPEGATIVAGNTTNSITVNFSSSAVSGIISVYGSNSCGNGPLSVFAVSVNQAANQTNVTFNANWNGISHVFPNEGCPAWTLQQNTVPLMPVFSGDSLVINAPSSDKYMNYQQSGSLIAISDTFCCEFRMRFVSGTYGDPLQRAAGLFLRFPNNTYTKLMIGQDEFFLWNGDNSKGSSVFAETDNAFHTYRIEVFNKSQIRVFYDGYFALAGSAIPGNSGDPQISFGKLTGNSYGQSRWLWFRHNAGTVNGNNEVTLLQPVDQSVDIVLNPTLSWLASGCVTTYHLQVAANPAFNAVLVNDSSLTTTGRQISGLIKGNHYYWRVRGKGYGLTGPWSATWQFKTYTDTLIVTNTKTISNDTTFAYVKVTPTGILTANSLIHVTGDLLIENGGVITHDTRNLNGLRVNVDDSLVIQPGGSINTDGKGLLGGPGGTVRMGESYDLSTGAIVRVTPEATGGSHGGLGGGSQTPAYIYGNEMNPAFLGSGGGGGSASTGQTGGNGGGGIFLSAGSLIHNGIISAAGQNGLTSSGASCGGGSGGSVIINAGLFSGNGSLQANGGNSGYGNGSGGGGGGRIAISSAINTYTGTIKATGGLKTGSGYSAGSAGTIWNKSGSGLTGNLILDNNNIEPGNQNVTLVTGPGARTYKSVQLKNKGCLTVTPGISPFVCQNQFLAENLSKLTINSNVLVSAHPFLLVNSQIYCADTMKLVNDSLTGDGTITGILKNKGNLLPGNPTGAITISGKYVQTPEGMLTIDIGGKNPGVSFDQVNVSGSISLAGSLKINLVNNFQPAIGDSFCILSGASRTGVFSTVTGWDNYKILYRNNRVTLLRIENINHPPVANAGPDRSYTSVYPVMLDGSGSYDPDTDPITYHWSSPAGITLSDSTAVRPAFISPVTLVIKVLTFGLRVNDGALNSATDSVNITVFPPPVLSVQTLASPSVICPGGSSQLHANVSGGFGNYTYSWSSQPAGFTSTIPHPTVTPASNTVYTVQVSDGISTVQGSVSVTIHSNLPPGPVTNLLPADSNFQVQPPAVFRWSPSLHASSYDFYLWRTTQPKPSVPTASDLTDTLYHFPTFINPNYIFYWQVVAKNFCFPNPTSGPVRVFSFNFFSDLTVSTVSHPDTVTAGTYSGVSFTIANNGIGGTGYNYWKDFVYLSSTPEFSANTAVLLSATDNVSALAAGGNYSRSVTLRIAPDLEGVYYIFVKTDANGTVTETNEDNNLVRASGSVYIKQPPYPDLYVRNVQPVSTKVVPDSAFEASWIVENTGNLAAIGGWSQRVSLLSGNKRCVIGFKQYTDPLPVSGLLSQSAVFTVPKNPGMEGPLLVEVLLIPYSGLVEKLNGQANNLAVSAQTVPSVKRMFINLAQPTVYENQGYPLQGVITRSGDPVSAMTVTLANSNTARLSVPVTVTLPAGQSEGYFPVSTINNNIVDGSASVSITASSPGYPDVGGQIMVLDDEIPSLSLQISKLQATEGDTVMVTVTRDLVTNSSLLVIITPAIPGQVRAPNTITIPAGQASVTFNLPVIDDNIPEQAVDLILTASQNGYNAGSQTLNITDNDIPQIEFTITPHLASEANGIYAAIGTIKRIVPGNGTNTIRFTTSMNGQLIVPTEIQLPQYTMQKQFNIGIVDNNLVDGNRTIRVTASVYLPNCGCGAPVSSGGTQTDSLTILDNDGPCVNLTAIPGTVAEGLDSAGMLVVYRNTLGGPQVTVNLTNSSPDEMTIPASVVIPAGHDSVSVPFASIDDTIQDGDQMVVLTANAPGYTKGASFAIVTDRNIPDLVITNFNLPVTTSAIGKKIPLSLTLKNQGFAVAAYGVEIKYFLSGDNVPDNSDLLISSYFTSSAISIGGTLTIQDTLITPGRLGNQYLIAIVNKDQKINELIFYNNQSLPKSLTVIPDYNAMVSVDGDVFNGNSPILIYGSATTVDNQPAVKKPVDVYVVVDGVRRDIRTMTDTNGLISVLFQPLNGEAGNFYTGACFPGQGLSTPQDNFIVLGMKYTGNIIKWDMFLGENRQDSLAIRNFSGIDLTGVTISVVSAPPGCQITFDPVGTLGGNATATATYHINATGLSPGRVYERVDLKIICAEGADYDFIAWFYCSSPTGLIKTVPVSLATKMVKGEATIKEFRIQNVGNGSTGLIQVMIPQVPWMTMVSTDTISSLAPHQTAVTSIRLTPTDEPPLNVPVTGGIAVNSANANAVTVPFSFEAISLETGDLRVDVTDEYSFYTASGAHVDSAHVILRHPYTSALIAEGLTNQNGILLINNIPEGNYTLVVESKNHNSYQNIIFVEKGKVNYKSVFISFQPVTYSWNVVPTQIQDHYEIKLIVEFATNVPVPVVLISMPDTMPHLEGTQTYPFIITLTNKGLITAEDVELHFPVDPEYEFTCLLDKVNIMAQQSLQVPVVMKRKATNKSGEGDCMQIILASFSYKCGEDHHMQSSIHTMTFNTRICSVASNLRADANIDQCSYCNPGEPQNGGGGGENAGTLPGINIPVLDISDECDPCMQEIAEFLMDRLCDLTPGNPVCEIYEALSCYNGIIENCGDDGDVVSLDCASAVSDCFGGLPDGIQIGLDLAGLCQPEEGGKSPSSLSFLPPIQEKMHTVVSELTAMKSWWTELYGDSNWVYSNKTEYVYFRNYFDSLNPMNGVTVTPELLAHRPTNITTDQVNLFISRWNNTLNYDNGLPYDSSNVVNYNTVEKFLHTIDSCEQVSQAYGYLSTAYLAQAQMDSLKYYHNLKKGSVCAKITLQFTQSMTMTREAFDGTLTVTNGHETKDLQNVLLDLAIKDDDGNLRNDLFQINTLSLNELSAINGSGTLGPKKTGTALVRFIPEKGAAPNAAKFYSFGGNLSYKDPFTDEIVTRTLYPVRLQVNPSPDLYLDYFMQRDILGDNALTTPVEPSIPAELGVMINNKGAGTANSVNLESSQPVIIDNEKGLLIDFNIIGSNISGHPRQLGLYDVNFGSILPGKVSVGQWWFTSSLLGHFVSYSATVNHLDSYGNRDLSLVSEVNIHELTHGLMAYGALYDTVGDFLVNDIPDGQDFPDHVYYSDGTNVPVVLADSVWTDGPVTILDTVVHLTVKPKSAGWNYTKISDPGNGLYRIASVTRNDGQVIPLDNMWLTYCTLPDGGDPIYENKLHFADLFNSTDTMGYKVVFEPVDQNPPAVDTILNIPLTATDIPVDSVDVIFTEPIIDSTFTYADMTLRCQGGPNLMDTSIHITRISDTAFRVYLTGKTNLSGYYTLVVQASGVSDLSGNYGKAGKMVSWIQAMSVPAITRFIGIPQNPGISVDSLLVLFNMPIYDSTFTLDDLKLIKNQADTIPVADLTILPRDPDHLLFRIQGLELLTNGDGQYRLKVRVTDIFGRNGQHGLSDQSAGWSVCTSSPPTAYAGDNDTICSNQFDQLSGTVSNASSFQWTTSGSGNFFNAATLTPVYQPSPADITSGRVTITLTAIAANNCSQSASSSFYLVIRKAPYAFAGTGDTLVTGMPFPVFNPLVLNATSLQWSSSGTGHFDNNQLLRPVYYPTVSDTGNITLTLTVTGQYPCQSVSSSLIIKYLIPTPPLIQASNVQFFNPDTASVTLNWIDGNGAKRIVFMKHDTTGIPSPEIIPVYTANTFFGHGSQISNSGWYCVFNGNTHPGGVTVTGLLAGNYYRLMVCEYNEIAGYRFYQTQGALQNPANRQTCQLMTPIISGDTAICPGANAMFSTQAGMTDYNWTIVPNGSLVSGQGTSYASFVCNTPGIKTVKVSYRFPGGCPSTRAKFNTRVRPLPSGNNAIAGPSSVCVGATGIAYYDSSFANTTSYQWTVPPDWLITQGQGSANIMVNFPSYTTSGNISVTGINECGSGQSSTYTVTINPLLTGVVYLWNKTIHNGDVICYSGRKIAAAGAGTVYIVENGGSATMIAADTVRLRPGTKIFPGGHFHALATRYCIPCMTSKSSVQITGIEPQNGEESSLPGPDELFFRIYPNPTGGELTIEWTDHAKPAGTVTIRVRNMLGEELLTLEPRGIFPHKISLDNLKSGIYFLMVTRGERSGMIKVIKW